MFLWLWRQRHHDPMFSPVSLRNFFMWFEERPLFNKRWIDGEYMVEEHLFTNLIENDQAVYWDIIFLKLLLVKVNLWSLQHKGYYRYLITL